MAANQKECKLLGLPPELRNRIWSYVVLQGCDLISSPVVEVESVIRDYALDYGPYLSRMVELGRPYAHDEVLEEHLPNIAKTCQQICSETSSMYYGANTFSFLLDGGSPSFTDWFVSRNAYVRHLRMVDVVYCQLLDCNVGCSPVYCVRLDMANDHGVKIFPAGAELLLLPRLIKLDSDPWFDMCEWAALRSTGTKVCKAAKLALAVELQCQGRSRFTVQDWVTVVEVVQRSMETTEPVLEDFSDEPAW